MAERWVRNHGLRFRPEDFGDRALSRITDDIGNARMVLLGGEHGRTSAEHLAMKLAIVRRLHQQLGFNVLTIDASLWECSPSLNPDQSYDVDGLMAACTTGAAQEEMRALFAYVASTQGGPRPLTLMGVGVNPSITGVALRRPATLAATVAPFDSVMAREVYTVDSAFIRRAFERDAQASGTRISDTIPAIITNLHRLSKAVGVQATRAGLPELQRARVALAAASLRSSADAAVRLRNSLPFTRGLNESAVGENFLFVADTLYPADRIVHWSTNDRVRRGSVYASLRGDAPAFMRAIRARHRPQEFYVLALHAVRGPTGRAGLVVTGEAGRGSALERAISDSGGRAVYFSTRGDIAGGDHEWLAVPTTDSRFIVSRSVILSEDYDAVLGVSGPTPTTAARGGDGRVARCCVPFPRAVSNPRPLPAARSVTRQ